MSTSSTHLAVLGRPIGHSKSPALHRAAYARLGLTNWTYEAVDVGEEELAAFVASRDPSWRGLSLTMPLKQRVLPLVDELDWFAELTGAANTVRFDRDGTRRGFNTDVGGIVRALGDAGVHRLEQGALIGGGATAASALVALAELGAERVRVFVRSPERAASLADLARRAGTTAEIAPLEALAAADDAGVVISTVPGGTELGVRPSAALREGAVLLDVAYDPWPSRLATDWLEAGGTVVHGLGMLLHQALLQVRVFVQGDPTAPLADEAGVLEVMRAAVS